MIPRNNHPCSRCQPRINLRALYKKPCDIPSCAAFPEEPAETASVQIPFAQLPRKSSLGFQGCNHRIDPRSRLGQKSVSRNSVSWPASVSGFAERITSRVQARRRLLAFHVSRWNNPGMIIGDRLRALREEKKLSQGDIEKRTGLVRPYISRIEHNHSVPTIETLEKMAKRSRPSC